MIVRVWRGWATGDHADAYGHLLDSEIVPRIMNRHIDGLRRAVRHRRRAGRSAGPAPAMRHDRKLPFAETRELIGGVYLLECADLDEALSGAANLSVVALGVRVGWRCGRD